MQVPMSMGKYHVITMNGFGLKGQAAVGCGLKETDISTVESWEDIFAAAIDGV